MTTSPRVWRSRVLRVAAAFLMMLSLVVTPGDPVAAQVEDGFLEITKTTVADEVAPNETFSYDVVVVCTSFGIGCVNAVVTDPIPAGLEVVGTPVIASGATGTVNVDGQDVTITFTNVLGTVGDEELVGLVAGASASITITVRVDPDLPYSASGVPIDNTATVSADNADSDSDTATVTPIIDLSLSATATKTVSPDTAIAVPGTPVTATLGGTNTSNTPVESLTIADPADVTTSNPFEYLEFTGFGATTLPVAADQVTVEVWDGSTWHVGTPAATPQLPTGVDAADVAGFRFVFSSSTGADIAQAGSGSVVLNLEHRDTVGNLTASHTVTNTAVAIVDDGTTTATSSPATDTHVIVPPNIVAAAGKVFSPDAVTAGFPTTVTLTGTNVGTAVTSMTITEPFGGTNPFTDGLTFTGFGTDGAGAGIVWPSGATGASVTFTYADGTETVTTDTPNTLPQPDPARTLHGFSVTFTGPIVAGANATIPFTADTDPNQVPEEYTRTNQVQVSVTDGTSTGTDTASDTLTSYVKRLATTVDKQISPAQILNIPGELVTVQLPAQVLPFPDSTTDAAHIVVQDPPTVPSSDGWWNAFDVRAISQTAIPAGATLTVRYWDGSAWVPLPGAVDLAGPQIVNHVIPTALRDTIQGLQFDFHNETGFPPGTRVQPNFSSQLRSQNRDGSGPIVPGDIANCAAATATAAEPGIAAGSDVTDPCPTIEVLPTDTGPGGNMIEKVFLEPTAGAGKTVIARSSQRIDARLRWSTGGLSNLDEVIISDTADPIPTADSVFNAFDLVQIRPINAAQDPWMRYDAVARVEIWNGTSWQRIANDPCPANCDGAFPNVNLTAEDRAMALGVRLVFVESPTRASRIGTDPSLPQVGDGVARSFAPDRNIRLVFEVRDQVRVPVSTPDPVLGTREYNLDDRPGEVLNTARASGWIDDTRVHTSTDDDIVTIIDVPLNVDIDKTWTGGPLGVPPTGTPTEDYPSGRLTVTATNATAARVDRLVITDPSDPTRDPFGAFDLKRIVAVSVPTGATSTTVRLTHADTSVTTHTVAQALVLSESALADVVGIEVEHLGRIAAGATATVQFDARLRATHRTTGDVPVAGTTIDNRAEAAVSDLGGTVDDEPTAFDDASITLAEVGVDIDVTKTFSPDVITEPSRGPITMTLTGQPLGPTRAVAMTITDVDPRFWNQYDLVEVASAASFTGPIDRVRVDVFTGGTFGTDASGVTVTGGDWVNGTVGTDFAIPASVDPADVQGIRFTFTKLDGSIWENPHSPIQSIPVRVELREELRTGGPVPSDMVGNDPAPGETLPGVATNEVVGVVTGSAEIGGVPITATDSHTDTVLYRHANNAVSVVKAVNGSTTGGSQLPGVAFPYTLTFTNVGDVAIFNPVVVDHVPGEIVFHDAVEPEDRYAYALSGAAPVPPTGLQMPVDPEDVTVEVIGDDVDQIRFTFPEGTVLEIGQTYEITILVTFAPGVPGNTQVVNMFGVTGDRPWDVCVGVLDPLTGECRDDVPVLVTEGAAHSSHKWVKALDDELGLLGSGPGCTPDADGFYYSGCFPLVKPGGTAVWSTRFVNSGNLPFRQLVAYDRLPAPGDTGVQNPLARGSQWRPLFDGGVTLVGAPDGATLAVEWSTDTVLCTSGPCAPGAWNPLTGDETTEQLDAVTALRFVVDFPDVALAPAAQFAIEFTMTAPAVSPTAGPDTIAYNSVAASATTTGGITTPRAEGNRVGIALATGPVSVLKLVEGDAAVFAPDEFPLRLVCEARPGTRWEGDLIPLGDEADLVLVEDGVATVVDLPWGSECTVTEDDAATMPTSFEATTVSVVREDQTIPVVIATNTYDEAPIAITKTVDPGALDQDGAPVSYGPFPVEVACTFLGEAVYADGHTGPGPMLVQVMAGETLVLDGLPARAECAVTEVDTMGGGTPTLLVETADGAADPIDEPGTELVLTAGDDGEATNLVTIVNRFEVGEVTITKTVDGAGAEFGTGPFTVGMVCTLSDASGERVVWDGTVVFGGGQPMEATITDLAADAECVVTEIDNGGATSVAISPDSFVVDAETPAEVSVVNTFDAGGLVVSKRVVGETTVTAFEVTLACTLAGSPVEIPGGATRTIATDSPGVYELLPVGAECVVTETDDGGADLVEIDGEEGPATVLIAAGELDVRVDNHFDPVDDDEDVDDGEETRDDDELPITGADIARWAGIGAGLVGVGFLLTRMRRRTA